MRRETNSGVLRNSPAIHLVGENDMSNANVLLVKGLYAAFKRGDIATIANALTEDANWQVHGRQKDFPTIGRWTGPKGAQEFFARVGEHLETTEFAPQEFHPAGHKVFVLGHYGWTVRKTGKAISADWCHVFTVKDGKVSEFHEFTDTASFAEAYRG
jgi:ketosteroid isomerase-like protein